MTGLLALVGGAEFTAGNGEHDARLSHASSGRPAHIVCSAVRTQPEAAVASARTWFARFGVEMTELRVRTRREASLPATVAAASAAGLVYIAGGDPGRTVSVLAGTPVWEAIAAGWRAGASLAGSSAGAMALCGWTLVRDRWPASETRRPIDALGLVPGCALLPHFESFGERWIPSAREALGAATPLVGVDERTAAVWDGVEWSVSGPGSVTVINGSARSRWRGGERVPGIPVPAAG